VKIAPGTFRRKSSMTEFGMAGLKNDHAFFYHPDLHYPFTGDPP